MNRWTDVEVHIDTVGRGRQIGSKRPVHEHDEETWKGDVVLEVVAGIRNAESDQEVHEGDVDDEVPVAGVTVRWTRYYEN